MSIKIVNQILDELGVKGGALTAQQTQQAKDIAAVVLRESDDAVNAEERFNFFLALLSFAVK